MQATSRRRPGIATTYKEDFNDNEEYFKKVRPILGTGKRIGRDIIVPTDWMASRMIGLGWAAKLDPSKIPNHKNLLDEPAAPRASTRTATTRCRGSRA